MLSKGARPVVNTAVLCKIIIPSFACEGIKIMRPIRYIGLNLTVFDENKEGRISYLCFILIVACCNHISVACVAKIQNLLIIYYML